MPQARNVPRTPRKGHACDEVGSMHQRALDLLAKELEKEDQALHIVAAEIKVPYHWLVALYYRRIKQPSVNRIQWIVEQLSGRTVRC